MRRLDLDHPRDIGGLLGTTFSVFGALAPVFVIVTFLVVAPVVLLVDGLWMDGLTEGADHDLEPVAGTVGFVLSSFVVPALITALHVVIVMRLAAGERPHVGEAVTAALRSGVRATGAVTLYALLIVVGFVLCILPGIYLSVRLYFAAQAAVVDRASPRRALGISSDVTDGRWWETFGSLLVMGIVVFLPAGMIAAIVGFVVDSPVAYILVELVTQTLSLSLSALFGTLLFFSLRARGGAAGSASVPLPRAPERPSFLPPQA
jgi:hypothetical protein